MNWAGIWVSGFALCIGTCSITAVELWGIFKGLPLAWDLGYIKVQLKMDSSTAFKLLQQTAPRFHKNIQLVNAIHELYNVIG